MAAPTTDLERAEVRPRARHLLEGLSATWALQALVVALAAAYLALFIVAGVLRVTYPFQLDPTESAVLTEVERVLRGQPIYVAPTLEYVPLIYGPAYFYAAAIAAIIVGPTFAAIRLISFLASLSSLTLVFLLVTRETNNPLAGLVASGFLAACTALMDSALDIGRVDATFLCLLLAGAYAARVAPKQSWIAGALLGLAAVAKVPTAAAPIALGIGVYLVYAVRLRAIGFFVAALTVPIVIILLSGPWAAWYIVDLPSHHAPGRDLIARFWLSDVLPRATLPLVIGPLFLVGAFARGERRRLLFTGALVLSLIGVAWASRMNGGGAPNVLLPGFAALAILLGVGLHEALRQFGATAPFKSYVLALCALQFGLLVYNPRSIVPFRSDRWADEELAAALATVPGPIFAPDFAGYLPASEREVQPLMTSAAELWGLYGGGSRPEGIRWRQSLEDSIRQHAFRSIILKIDDPFLKELVEDGGYVNRGPLIPQADEFYSWRTPRTPQPQLYVSPDA